MSLKTKVKISGVTNLSDARYCAGMMVDYLGFNIDPGYPDFVSAIDFQEISEWISGVNFVAECGNLSTDEIVSTIDSYSVSHVEIKEPNQAKGLIHKDLKIIFAIEIAHGNLQTWFKGLDTSLNIDLLKLSCEDSSLFDQVESSLSNEIQTPVLKGFDITDKNIVDLNPIWTGVELNATAEDKPGLKDYGHLMDILELLEED